MAAENQPGQVDGEHGLEDDPSAGPTYMWMFVGTALLIMIVYVLQALYYSSMEDELLRKQRMAGKTLVSRQLESQRGKLEKYEHQEGALKAIPIEKAMELVVKEQGRR